MGLNWRSRLSERADGFLQELQLLSWMETRWRHAGLLLRLLLPSLSNDGQTHMLGSLLLLLLLLLP